MSNTVRMAQIGASFTPSTHASIFRDTMLLMPELEIVAFYDPNPAAVRPKLQPALQDRPIYDDIALLLEQERPEAVLITLPADLIPGAIVQAAAAGAHVYAEKPCARSAADFRPAAEAIRRAGLQFATGYLRRFDPVGQAIKAVVDQGPLGRLVSINAHWITRSVRLRTPEPYLFRAERSGGGIMHWLGCHWLDFMRWSTSAEVVEVAAVFDTLSGEPIDVEDVASLALRYDNGMVGSLHCTYVTGDGRNQQYFGLRGSNGWLDWDNNGPELRVYSSDPSWLNAPMRVMRFEPAPIGGYYGGTGMTALRNFIASFREGSQPVFTPDDALRTLEVLDAAGESARTGRRVPVA